MTAGPGLIDRLAAVVGAAHLRTGEAAADYAHDATFIEEAPLAAVLPASTGEVAAVVGLCAEAGVPVTARGSGTGLSGGPVPLGGGVVLSLERLTELEVDPADAVAVAGAGVITLDLQEAAAAHGLMYPPDPASHATSTIGGNVACNSGGMACLKYGVTADYVIGLTVVLADGRVLELGGRTRKRASGYRLLQLFVGSEGTLGIVTRVTVKLIPRPRHRATAMVAFAGLEAAAGAVARLLGSGHLPAALEFIDRGTLEVVADLLPPGFGTGHAAVLVVEADGNDRGQVLPELAEMVELLDGVDNRVAQSEAEREGLWKARRSVGHAVRELPFSSLAEDVAVPISRVPELVRRTVEVGERLGLRIITFGHAGDGNLHPNILFEESQRHLVGEAAAAIFRLAIELGGTVSAEHGLGALKRDHAELEHGPIAIGLMRGLKSLLDPDGILNPHKVLPEGSPGPGFLADLPGWGRTLASGHDRTEVGG